jgi:hypothetical protein
MLLSQKFLLYQNLITTPLYETLIVIQVLIEERTFSAYWIFQSQKYISKTLLFETTLGLNSRVNPNNFC